MRIRPSHLISAVLAALSAVCCSGGGNFCCSDIDISLSDTLTISRATVRSLIIDSCSCCIGENPDSLDLGMIEGVLDSYGSIRKSEVWTTRGGIIHVKVDVRVPLMRFASDGKMLFVDAEGFIFPCGESCPEDVPLIRGTIPVMVPDGFRGFPSDAKERVWIAEMIKLVGHNISDVVAHADGELEFKLQGMEETVIFGHPDNMEAKFAKIDEYIRTIQPLNKGYKYVNVKYNGQIICRKDI